MSDITNEALKPCPFCGSTDISHGEVLTGYPSGKTSTQSQCNRCKALGAESVLDDGGVDFGDVKAIAAWNRRAEAQPVAAKVHIEGMIATLKGAAACDVCQAHDWVTEAWAEEHFGSPAEAKFVAMASPANILALINIIESAAPVASTTQDAGQADARVRAAVEAMREAAAQACEDRSANEAYGHAKCACSLDAIAIRALDIDAVLAQASNPASKTSEDAPVLDKEASK